MGILIVTRTGSAVGALAGWNVYLDGNKAGKLKNGKSIELEVLPGPHRVYVSTSQWSSNSVDFVIDGTHPRAVVQCSVGKAGKSQVMAGAAFGLIGAAVAGSRHRDENEIDAVLIE